MTRKANQMSRAIAASGTAHALVKNFEARGGKPDLVAYKRTGDPITIGFGHTGEIKDPETGELRKMVTSDIGALTITAEYANDLYREDSKEGERRVDRYFPDIPLTQGQRDALFSFCYNLKLESIISSTLRKMILSGEYTRETLVEWWVKYRNPKSIFEEGLYRRRLAELCLWFGWPYKQAWQAELRRDNRNEISFRSNPELILYRAEAEAEAQATGSLPELVEVEASAPVKAEEPAPAPVAVEEPEPELTEEPAPVAIEPFPEMPEPPKPEPVVVAAPQEPAPPPIDEPIAAPRAPLPSIPYGNVDPMSDPKSMISSKRFWGLFILILSRFSFMGIAGETVLGGVVGDPLLFDAAAASLAMGALFFVDVGGQWLRWFGEKKATRTLK